MFLPFLEKGQVTFGANGGQLTSVNSGAAIQGPVEKALWQRTMVGFWELTVASS